MFTNNNNLIKHSLIFLGGLMSGMIISYKYNNSKKKEKRYTKTHYNIIIRDTNNNELLESYYIDYNQQIIYFEKELENIDIIFYTTSSTKPIYTKTNFSGNSFKIAF